MYIRVLKKKFFLSFKHEILSPYLMWYNPKATTLLWVAPTYGIPGAIQHEPSHQHIWTKLFASFWFRVPPGIHNFNPLI